MVHLRSICCLLSFIVAYTSAKLRVAIIFRGKHTSYRHFIDEQHRLLVQPLIHNGIIVDIFLISPNSTNWQIMESQYKAMSNGIFASQIEATDEAGLDAQHGEEISDGLKIAQKACGKNDEDIESCWNAIIIWHFAVAPKISIINVGFVSKKLMLPWLEGHSPLPTSENTITAKQIRKSCAAYHERYIQDNQGQRSAHVVFLFDIVVFKQIKSLLSSNGQKKNEFLDAHYMFQRLIDSDMVNYIYQGYWETNPKNSNPLFALAHNHEQDRSAFETHHCCAESLGGKKAVPTMEVLGTFLSIPQTKLAVSEYQVCPSDVPHGVNSTSSSSYSSSISSSSSSSSSAVAAAAAPKFSSSPSTSKASTPLRKPFQALTGLSNVFHHVKDHSGHEAPQDMSVAHPKHISSDRNNTSIDIATITSPASFSGPSVSLITKAHTRELNRLAAINWDKYPAFTHHQKGMADAQVRYSNTPCFDGCAELNGDNPAFWLQGESKVQAVNKHPPGSFSLVIPWCCEWVNFIFKEVDFKGRLKEIYLYDKCSHSGLEAKDMFHVKQDLEMHLSDKDCVKPSREMMIKNIGQNKKIDIDNMDIHFVDLNEPGRSSCMSTDECGAYLAHMVKFYDRLTDGMIFMQADPRHAPTGSIRQIIDWTDKSGIAPIAYYPLGSKQGAGGNPKNCLQAWQPTLFPDSNEDVGMTRRTGNYRNGIFYVSRLFVRARPRAFWYHLYEFVNTTEMCTGGRNKACKLEDHRPWKDPPVPSLEYCKATPYTQDACYKSCNALEHVWGHVLCQPCHNVDKNSDPRYPWTAEARKHPSGR